MGLNQIRGYAGDCDEQAQSRQTLPTPISSKVIDPALPVIAEHRVPKNVKDRLPMENGGNQAF